MAAIALALAALTGALVAATPSPARAATVSKPAGISGFDIYQLTSHAQTASDFTSAYAKGARFVYIKASGGVKVTNTSLANQIKYAKAAGLLYGTYHLAAPNTGSGAAQATWFKNHGGTWAKGGSVLPPLLDLEPNTTAQPKGDKTPASQWACYKMTPAQLVAWVTQFSSTTASLVGRAPIIYTSASFWQDCMGNTTALGSNQLFVARHLTNTSTGPGALPAPWASYSLWQYSGTADSPLPGDQDIFNGTMLSLHLLADPTYGSGTKTSTRKHDYSGDGKADVLTRFTDGSLRMYRGTGKGGFSGYANVGSGKSFTAIVTPGDLNGDGIPDLLGRTSNGTLSFYPGKKGGGFGASKTAATGMNAMNLLTGVGDFNGDGKADLLARDAKGVLWLYEGNGAGAFVGRVQVGSGQSAVKQIVGVDNFGTGHSKGIVTSDASGTVRFYPRTASGFGASTVIGTGWTVYNTLVSPGDLTGDGVSDLLVRRSNGEVSMYAGTGSSKLKARAVVVTGWSPFTWIG